MPRKLRRVALVLALVLSATMTCQAAQAAPLGTLLPSFSWSGGDFVSNFWSWLAGHLAGTSGANAGSGAPGGHRLQPKCDASAGQDPYGTCR